VLRNLLDLPVTGAGDLIQVGLQIGGGTMRNLLDLTVVVTPRVAFRGDSWVVRAAGMLTRARRVVPAADVALRGMRLEHVVFKNGGGR
jgi:hypothetical protein